MAEELWHGTEKRKFGNKVYERLTYDKFYDKFYVEFTIKFMSTASILSKEKIVSLSELQKNPSKALDGDIVRIVKNGKEIGIFMSKEEFEDFLEEHLEVKKSFKDALEKALRKSKKEKLRPVSEIL